MAWIGNILESEFFWGIIVGLSLTVIGSYFLALFTTWQQRRERKEVLKNFCVDTVTNIREIIDDMVATRSKANQDYLTLLDLEIQVFTRNREHTVYLPKDVRDKVRKFMTDCAIRRAEIGNHLTTFYNRRAVADQYQAQGDTMHAGRHGHECASASCQRQRRCDQGSRGRKIRPMCIKHASPKASLSMLSPSCRSYCGSPKR